MGGKDRDKEDMEFLKGILEYLPFEYASKFASVIDRAREAGVTDTREMRRLLEEIQPEAVEVWEDHLYSNRDPEYARMSFEEFQRSIRGEPESKPPAQDEGRLIKPDDSSEADDFHADIKMGFNAEPKENSPD